MPNAPVDAMPPSAGKAVVGWSPAPPDRPVTLPALISLFTKLTKALLPAALPAVPGATAQLAALVMSLIITASDRPPPKSRGLLKKEPPETLVCRSLKPSLLSQAGSDRERIE